MKFVLVLRAAPFPAFFHVTDHGPAKLAVWISEARYGGEVIAPLLRQQRCFVARLAPGVGTTLRLVVELFALFGTPAYEQ